jgi:coiled-coil and C2 domain-containing protein 2A
LYCWLLLLPSPGAEQLTEGNVLPERERRFLGCIRLSLAALYQAEVVDGVFKVRKPSVVVPLQALLT